MTLTEVLVANINKLGNLKVPVREAELFNALNEIAHDLRVCVDAIQQADAKAAEASEQQTEHGEEVPQDEADPQ